MLELLGLNSVEIMIADQFNVRSYRLLLASLGMMCIAGLVFLLDISMRTLRENSLR